MTVHAFFLIPFFEGLGDLVAVFEQLIDLFIEIAQSPANDISCFETRALTFLLLADELSDLIQRKSEKLSLLNKGDAVEDGRRVEAIAAVRAFRPLKQSAFFVKSKGLDPDTGLF